jgi:hypothetical protein
VDLPDALAPLSFLLGRWRGEGTGSYPTIEPFVFTQELNFEFYGKPVLAYSSSTWAGDDGRPLARETGFWRVTDPVEVEVLLALPTGLVEVLYGRVADQAVDLATDLVARTRTAKEVTAERRHYDMVAGELRFRQEMAAVGQPLQPHIEARLRRLN